MKKFDKKEYNKQWLKEHPEKQKEYRDRYLEKNRDLVNKRKRERYNQKIKPINDLKKKIKERQKIEDLVQYIQNIDNGW